MAFVGVLGAMLSESWYRNTLGYLDTSSHRYEIIKQLECDLDYDFINKAYNRINQDKKLYFSLALHEVHAPLIFQLGFTILIIIGMYPILKNDIVSIICAMTVMGFLITLYIDRIKLLESKIRS